LFQTIISSYPDSELAVITSSQTELLNSPTSRPTDDDSTPLQPMSRDYVNGAMIGHRGQGQKMDSAEETDFQIQSIGAVSQPGPEFIHVDGSNEPSKHAKDRVIDARLSSGAELEYGELSAMKSEVKRLKSLTVINAFEIRVLKSRLKAALEEVTQLKKRNKSIERVSSQHDHQVSNDVTMTGMERSTLARQSRDRAEADDCGNDSITSQNSINRPTEQEWVTSIGDVELAEDSTPTGDVVTSNICQVI